MALMRQQNLHHIGSAAAGFCPDRGADSGQADEGGRVLSRRLLPAFDYRRIGRNFGVVAANVCC